MVKKNKALYWFLGMVLLLALTSVGAWLISANFPTRSFVSAFWLSCLVAVLCSVVFALFNILEACVVAFSPLVLSLVAIPVLTRVHWDAAGYIALNGIIAGFVSSRPFHKLL